MSDIADWINGVTAPTSASIGDASGSLPQGRVAIDPHTCDFLEVREMHIRLAAFALLVVPAFASAQQQNPLVGAWERTSLKGARGASVQPPAPAAFLLLTADGFFVQMGIPTDRPKIAKPVPQMTREELLARFNNVDARRGTWTVSGDRLTRTDISSTNPNTEGVSEIRLFKIQGNTLILTSPDPSNQVEARFQRVKSVVPAR